MTWQKLTQDGIDLIRQGLPQQALPLLQKAHQLAPGNRDAAYWLANARRMTGQWEQSLSLFRKILAARPDDFDASFAMAFLLRDMGNPSEIARVLLRASRFPGTSEDQLLQITGFLRDVNQAAAAIEVCETVVERNPAKAGLHFKLARMLQSTGNFDRARDELRKTLDIDPSTGPAWTLLAQQKSFLTTDDADYQRIRTASEQSLGKEADMCVQFAFGKAQDDLGNRARAWQQYQEANGKASLTFPWNGSAWDRFVEQTVKAAASSPAVHAPAGRNAVFIVGMPRSGTTLLEQLLNRHPAISGRGETNLLAHFSAELAKPGNSAGNQLEGLSRAYWTQLRLDGPESGFYLDKNPLNFRFLKDMFRLLPNARVLHMRRDGRDSCLSCFFQLFQHADTAFSYRTEDLVSYYAGYRKLMNRWESTHPQRIHTLDYSELVKSPDDVLGKALEFLGLEWNESMNQPAAQDSLVRSASVWQARQGVHTQSVGRWREYYEQAPEFFDRLAEIDKNYA